ncbi:MAG: DUF58 domain-containing protein [Planctomycetota bacterium]|nr:DUF58 domain-containing protein [Planctomycetota bacterium]MDA1105802.1 DUF58 domain-containing protein [Planctomycetota bacterium]
MITRVDELLDSRLMARLDTLDVVSRKVFMGKVQGERRSRRRGQSVEFADYRPYAEGDDLRFVDWNIYGRLDRLFLKMFMEEEDLSLILALDCSGSMKGGEPSKFDFVRRLAMSLGYIGLVNQSRVGCFAFGGDRTERLTGLRGRRRIRDLGQWILAREAGGEFQFPDAMRSIALGGQGRGVLVVVSDFLFPEGAETGLKAIAGRGFDVFAIQCLAPEEIDPSTALTGDMRLVDSERGTPVEVSITTRTVDAYKDRLREHTEDLREACIRRGITHMQVRTDMPMDDLLLDYLRRRGLLK